MLTADSQLPELDLSGGVEVVQSVKCYSIVWLLIILEQKVSFSWEIRDRVEETIASGYSRK